MRIRPGRNLVVCAGGLVAASLLTFFWPPVAWLIVAVMVAGAAGMAFDYRRLGKQFDHVTVERTMPAVIGRDVPFVVALKILSDNSRPLSGELRDEVPADAVPVFRTFAVEVAAKSAELVEAAMRIPNRGRYEFGPAWLRLRGGFGLVDGQRPFDCRGTIKVLPEAFSSEEGLRQDELSAAFLVDKLVYSRQQGAGTEFESLSEYRQGDDPRRIDWRATARYGHPIVRRYQIERHRDVMIVLDCGRLMGADTGHGSKLDCGVDAALMLCRVALESGDRCGVALFEDKVVGYLPPVSGARSLRWITESVYDVATQWNESDFSQMFATLQLRQTKRSLVVVISDIVDVETSQRFRASLASLTRRHVVLFAALRTPQLRELVYKPVASVLDGSRKAVTFRILREREQAIHSLRRSGIHVLDVEPHQLSAPLINQFIELRQRNVL